MSFLYLIENYYERNSINEVDSFSEVAWRVLTRGVIYRLICH